MKHALIIGGTGMLLDASHWLLKEGFHVTMVARNQGRMDRFIRRANAENLINPLLVDYCDSQALKMNLEQTICKHGHFDLVLAWIHSHAADALSSVVDLVSKEGRKWELYHVLGSATNLSAIKKRIEVPEHCMYHLIRLGFVVEGNHSRWLTNEEISQGVIEAIKGKERLVTVGVVDPWEMRP